jgi:hypothetical protein
MPSPIDNTLLRVVGAACFGEQWQSDLARALDVDPRTVRHWVADKHAPRPGVYTDLVTLLIERRTLIDDMLDRVRSSMATSPRSTSREE